MDIQVLKTYTQQGLCRAVDILNFPHEFPVRTRLLGFRFLLQYHHMDRVIAPTKKQIVQKMKVMIDEYYTRGTQESNSVLMELVDMLIDFSPADGRDLLAYLREKQLTANNAGPVAVNTAPECTVYADSQNVHNASVSESVRKVAKYITSKFGMKFGDDPEGKKKKIEHYDKVRSLLCIMFGNEVDPVIERLYIDNAHFNIGYTVDEVFMAVLNWIDHEVKRYTHEKRVFPVKDVMIRIKEELIEMKNYCSTGLLSRVVNSIQGFTEDVQLEIRLSDKDQIKSVVFNHLNRSIQEHDDADIMDGMISEDGPERQKFLDFVQAEMTKCIPGWKAEYGDDIVGHLGAIVGEYVGINERKYQ